MLEETYWNGIHVKPTLHYGGRIEVTVNFGQIVLTVAQARKLAELLEQALVEISAAPTRLEHVSDEPPT